MNRGVDKAISGLRWTLSLVVLSEALHFAISPTSARHVAHFGLPLWMRPALAWSEAAAALLLLAPMTAVVGGYALLLIFVLAASIHFYGGE